MPIGYNILGAWGGEITPLLHHIEFLPPTPYVVLDNAPLAKGIQGITQKHVYHRKLQGIGDKTDDNIQDIIPEPHHFIGHVQNIIDLGVGVYVNNEPRWDQHCLDWTLEVAKLLVAQNVPAVLGNWSIGTPEPEDLHMAADLVRFVQQHPDLLTIGLHEGGLNSWVDLMPGITLDNWQDIDPDTTIMDYTGRYRRWYHTFGHVNIGMTEWTFDNIGGNPDGAPIHRIGPIWSRLYSRDDTEQFFAEQVHQAYTKLYGPDNVWVCMFCWGAPTSQWHDYDFARAPLFQRAVEFMRWDMVEDKPASNGRMEQYIVVSDVVTNIRAAASINAPRVGNLRDGDVIRVATVEGNIVVTEADGYAWVTVKKGEVEGNAASDFFALKPVPTELAAVLEDSIEHAERAKLEQERAIEQLRRLRAMLE